LSKPINNSTISLAFRYTERDYARGLRAHFGASLRIPLDIAVIVLGLVIGVYCWRAQDLHWFGVACVSASVLFALVLLAAFTIMPALLFRSEPKFRDDYSLSFSPEGIHFRTAHIDSRLQWAMYSRALVDRHSYILYYGARRFTVIPKRVFPSPEEQQAFEQLLTEHVLQIRRRGAEPTD